MITIKIPKREPSPDFAFRLWQQKYPHKFIDSQIAEVLTEKIVPCAEVVRLTRKVLCLTAT